MLSGHCSVAEDHPLVRALGQRLPRGTAGTAAAQQAWAAEV